MTTTVSFAQPDTGSTPPPVEAPSDRPSWLPENFKTPEDLAASYKELQAKLTQTSQQKAELEKGATPPVTPPETPKDPAEDPTKAPTAEAVVEAAGFNVETYSTEFASTGDVTPENRAKIAEGLKATLGERAQEIVDAYIDGQKAVLQNNTNLFLEAAGGADAYQTITKWAGSNLTKEEIDGFNRTIDSGDRTATMFAIEALRGRYERAEGKVPTLLKAGAGAVSSIAGFGSTAEMTAAMRDPRYKTDPAFRESVKQRLAM